MVYRLLLLSFSRYCCNDWNAYSHTQTLLQMFGRGGRDGKPSTCVLLYRASSVKGKGVDPGLKLLLKDGCIRKKFCQLLESTFLEDDQKDHFCCSCCDYDPVDPNGFFVFAAAKSTAAGTRKRRAAASVENLRDPITAVDKDVLAGQLAEWRAQKAVECGLTCLGEEAVATNHIMEKLSINTTDVEQLTTLWHWECT